MGLPRKAARGQNRTGKKPTRKAFLPRRPPSFYPRTVVEACEKLSEGVLHNSRYLCCLGRPALQAPVTKKITTEYPTPPRPRFWKCHVPYFFAKKVLTVANTWACIYKYASARPEGATVIVEADQCTPWACGTRLTFLARYPARNESHLSSNSTRLSSRPIRLYKLPLWQCKMYHKMNFIWSWNTLCAALCFHFYLLKTSPLL